MADNTDNYRYTYHADSNFVICLRIQVSWRIHTDVGALCCGDDSSGGRSADPITPAAGSVHVLELQCIWTLANTLTRSRI